MYIQGRRSAVMTTSATSEATRLFDRRSEKTRLVNNVSRLVDNVSRLRGKKINPCHGTVALVRTAPLKITSVFFVARHSRGIS